MGALSPVHLIIVLVIALLVIGPGKLPETAAPMQAAAPASGGTATDDTGTTRPS
jgi:Sec-independent protein translocase protein TatA